MGIRETRVVSEVVHPRVRAPSLEHAADVIGDIPEPFRLPFAQFRQEPENAKSMDLADRRGTSRMEVSVTNWPEVRQTVEERYSMAVAQSLGLVAWIRSRVEMLRRGRIVTIALDSKRARGGARLRVSQAGSSRLVDVSKTSLRLLRRLLEKREIWATPKQKLELIAALTELKPHLRSVPNPTVPRRKSTRVLYTVEAAVLQGFALDVSLEKESKRESKSRLTRR